jgi:hypothetical protein
VYGPDQATHIRVLLVLRYSSDGGKTYQERTFTKVFELPVTFSGS